LVPRANEDAIVEENLQFQAHRESYGGEMLGGIVFPQDFDYEDDGIVPDLRCAKLVDLIAVRAKRSKSDLLPKVHKSKVAGIASQNVFIDAFYSPLQGHVLEVLTSPTQPFPWPVF
jgi:phosphomannomutase